MDMGLVLGFIVGLILGLIIGGTGGRRIIIKWLRMLDKDEPPPPPPRSPMP